MTSSRWTGYKGTGTRDFYDVDIAWDEASNITSVVDHIHTNYSDGKGLFDVVYGMDDLHRLRSAVQGHFSGGSISGTPTREERWEDGSSNLGLSQTGNWLNRQLKTGGVTELNETNTFNNANELLERDTNSSAPAEFTFAYNKVGQQTSDGGYSFKFDVWGRLRFVSTGGNVVVEHRYNGLGFRIAENTYDLSEDPSVPGPWTYFAYDERWRIVAVFHGTDSDPDSVYVHHAAGLGGYGGSSYIDSVILRDRDNDESEGREERIYYCQNWRSDVSALLTEAGGMVEWVKYAPYGGDPFALPAGDTDSDGKWSATDDSNITGGGAYTVRKDANLDGVVNSSDVTHANSITGGYQSLGRGVLTSAGVENRIGYAGYRYDDHLAGAGRHLYHVRYRVYQAHIGRWLTRDPAEYEDGMNLYEYVRGMAIIGIDPYGLDTAIPVGGGCFSGTCGGTSFPRSQVVPPPAGNRMPYPSVPCRTEQRKAACRRWATQQCDSRAAAAFNAACRAECISAASECCSGRGCNRAGSAGRCIGEGVSAMANCLTTRPARKACFAACIAGVMNPGGTCYWPCRICDAATDPAAVAGCLVGCSFTLIPCLPAALQIPYKKCVLGCLAGLGMTGIITCPMCWGCVLGEAWICARGCGY